VQELFSLSSIAEINREKEDAAACLIQKSWKGYVTRKWIAYLWKTSIKIQKIFRGYAGRMLFKQKVISINLNRRMQVYNINAVKFQKIWRGYASRKYKFDFYARKLYLKHIQEKMEETRISLETHKKSQKLLHQQQAIQNHIRKLNKIAGENHHLLGTATNP
jgi:hypothetical protein